MCSYNEYIDQSTCQITLQNKELWSEFHDCQTEMIITKVGRRMFPAIQVQISGLDPEAPYCVFMEMTPASNCRYRYAASGGWAPAGGNEAHSPCRFFVHQDSPATGKQWMSQVVSFDKLKLTNTATPPPGQVVLNSMHKYQPKIIIAKTSDLRDMLLAPSVAKIFRKTSFIAVTAYQNDKITRLKIDNNPFAKGFRVNGQSKCKRKRTDSEEKPRVTALRECRSEPSTRSPSPISINDDRNSYTSSSGGDCSCNLRPVSRENAHYNYNRHPATSPWYSNTPFYHNIPSVPLITNHEFVHMHPPMYALLPYPYNSCQPYQYSGCTPLFNPMSLQSAPKKEEAKPSNTYSDFSIQNILKFSEKNVIARYKNNASIKNKKLPCTSQF